MVVRSLNLGHPGGFYIYRVHNQKIDDFCKQDSELAKLRDFMNTIFDSCPDDYFGKGPRGSSLKFKTQHKMHELLGHNVCQLAKHGLELNNNRFKSNHSKVQLFMLENDMNTVAVEVPIWLNHFEMDGYQNIFGSSDPLTGHIDVLSIDDGKIWVWDYKPNALKEKYASTQVYFYSLMLSKRTDIPLDKFRCGYFDWERAYMFKPEPLEAKSILNKSLVKY